MGGPSDPQNPEKQKCRATPPPPHLIYLRFTVPYLTHNLFPYHFSPCVSIDRIGMLHTPPSITSASTHTIRRISVEYYIYAARASAH